MTDALAPADEHLVSLSKDGNLTAFNRLVERYQTPVYSLCFRLVGERGAAEDATQEAFLSAFKSISHFEGGSFRSWLFRIAANQSKDELRRRGRRPADSLSLIGPGGEYDLDLPDTSESAAEAAERAAVIRGIEGALIELPFDQRQVILLSDVHGYHYEEIARITQTNVGTVKSRIHRGRERLRALLAEQPELFGQHGRLDD
ncbi:MAG: sigma-70 family RNA polymerase sigma factor [bacterium]